MKIRHAYLVCIALLLCSCSDFLDVIPKDKQTQQQLFATRGGYYTASNGIYNNIASASLYGRNLSFEMIELMGRRYTFANVNNTYLYALNTSNFAEQGVEAALSDVWDTAYSTILNCNVVLDNLSRNTGVLTGRESALLEGEMLAVRAFLHFDMLRLFGPVYSFSPGSPGIPYNESAAISALPFIKADSVLKFRIMRDLDRAEALLKENDPVITDGPMASAPGDGGDVYLRYRQLRANYYAVKALKARVYLYAGDKKAALAEARSLLEDAVLQGYFPPVDLNKLLANQQNPDRVFSTEVQWAIYKKDRKDIYTNHFNYETAGALHYLQPRNYLASNIFANATQDCRFQSQWQTTTGSAGHDFVKFKAIQGPDPNDPASAYFYATLMSLVRVSELYYIAAECEPDISAGYGWLNQIRRRRGLTDLPAGSENDLMTEIRKEYIREFAGEGQVFFLYKRLGITMPATENGSANVGTFQATDANYVPPVPDGEMDKF